MNSMELYFLNSVLDDKDISFIPRPKERKMSMLLADAVKESLIQKGLLKNVNEFTDEGVRYTRNLMLFKEAARHVRIGNLTLGLHSESEGVTITYNPLYQKYKVKLVNSSDIVQQIVEGIPFLQFGENSVQGTPTKLSTTEFEKCFELNVWNHFRLTVQQDNASSDEIYFLKDEKLFLYDCTRETLCPINKQYLLDCMAERMVLT